MMSKIIFFAMVYSFRIFVIADYSKAKDTFDTLFQSYSRYIIPSEDQYQPLTVTISLTLTGLIDLDETSETLTTVGFLGIRWKDFNLAWDTSDPDTVTQLKIPQEKIWKPNIQLFNSIETMRQIGGNFFNVDVQSDGRVHWEPYQTFKSLCPIDVRKYPFDEQTCEIRFASWGYFATEVNITEEEFGGFDLDGDISNGEWKVLSNSLKVHVPPDDHRSQIVFFLTLRRKFGNVLINFLVPVIILAVLNIFTFVIPAESGEKTGYTITVFLAFAVFLTIVSDRLPDNSDQQSYLGLFLLILLVAGCTTIIATVIQVRIVVWESTVPPKIRAFTAVIQRTCCQQLTYQTHKISPVPGTAIRKHTSDIDVRSYNGTDGDKESTCGNENANEDEVEYITWKDVCSASDKVLFCLSLLTLLISSCIFVMNVKK